MDSSIQINGPVGLNMTSYAGKKYIFFNDFHVDYGRIDTGKSGKECNSCVNRENCSDLENLLVNIFSEADENNKGVELYTENSFVKIERTGYPVQRTGGRSYLGNILEFFKDCFTKSDCKFKNTLFQYSDIRSGREEGNFIDYLYYNFTWHLKYQRYGFEVILENEFRKAVNEVSKGKYVNNDILKTLIDKLFFQKIDGENVAYNLYKLYLTSDDVINDINNLFDKVDLDKKYLEKYVFPKPLIVNRDDKIIHRIRSQFLALEKEGKYALSKKIINYILFKYKNYNFNIFSRLKDIINSLEIYNEKILKSKAKQNKFDKYIDALDKNVGKFISELTDNKVFIMDSYTLPRLFREFIIPGTNIKTDKKIVFAGNFHTRNYIDFFEKELGTKFKKYNESVKKEKCVHISVDDYFWMIN